jgi:hypothetical protein
MYIRSRSQASRATGAQPLRPARPRDGAQAREWSADLRALADLGQTRPVRDQAQLAIEREQEREDLGEHAGREARLRGSRGLFAHGEGRSD